jgi:multidrug efflux pump subunit AcrB
MDLMGFTLNGLSLLALSLVAGVLVDDAIVEIENIVRHMRMGKSAFQAAIDAADEIGLAVVATTMCIVAVFLPVGLMPGISGQFFKNFGLTIVAAVLVSLAVARMITPMVAAYFLAAKGHQSHGEGRMMDLYMKVLAFTLDTRRSLAARAQLEPAPFRFYYGMIETVLIVLVLGSSVASWQALSAALAPLELSVLLTIPLGILAMLAVGFLVSKLINWVIGLIGRGYGEWHAWFFARVMVRAKGDHRVWAFGVGIAALGLTVMMLANMPQQFQPTINDDSSRINIEMVPGTTIAQTEKIADQVEAIIRRQPEVSRVMERVREGNARLYIMLKEKRDTTSIEF